MICLCGAGVVGEQVTVSAQSEELNSLLAHNVRLLITIAQKGKLMKFHSGCTSPGLVHDGCLESYAASCKSKATGDLKCPACTQRTFTYTFPVPARSGPKNR